MGTWGPITKGVRIKALQRGCSHPTENFWIFSIKMVHFGGFWGVKFEVLILQISSILFHAEVKKQCISVMCNLKKQTLRLTTVRAHHLQMKGLHTIERPWNLTSCRHARQSILLSHWIKFSPVSVLFPSTPFPFLLPHTSLLHPSLTSFSKCLFPTPSPSQGFGSIALFSWLSCLKPQWSCLSIFIHSIPLSTLLKPFT